MAGGVAPGIVMAPARTDPTEPSRARAAATGRALVREADAQDDHGMRALLRRSAMAGSIRLAFTREPAYALGEGMAGGTDITVVADEGGQVRAMGRCSVQSLTRNGAHARVGYLGELRADSDRPGVPRLLREGYALLAERAVAAGVQGFVTAVADDNARARRVLEHGGRMGLPRYVPLAGLVTLVMPAARRSPVRASERGSARPEASPAVSPEELTAYLANMALRSQLALAWDSERWAQLASHGVTPADVCVVRSGGRITAAAIVWDQRAFRQTRVMGYGPALALARPVVNAFAAVFGGPMLPSPGSVLPQGTLLAASAESASAWRSLIPLVRARAAEKGLRMVAITLDRRDDAVAAIRAAVRVREYCTTLYEVRYAAHAPFADRWADHWFRPEAGLL